VHVAAEPAVAILPGNDGFAIGSLARKNGAMLPVKAPRQEREVKPRKKAAPARGPGQTARNPPPHLVRQRQGEPQRRSGETTQDTGVYRSIGHRQPAFPDLRALTNDSAFHGMNSALVIIMNTGRVLGMKYSAKYEAQA